MRNRREKKGKKIVMKKNIKGKQRKTGKKRK